MIDIAKSSAAIDGDITRRKNIARHSQASTVFAAKRYSIGHIDQHVAAIVVGNRGAIHKMRACVNRARNRDVDRIKRNR